VVIFPLISIPDVVVSTVKAQIGMIATASKARRIDFEAGSPRRAYSISKRTISYLRRAGDGNRSRRKGFNTINHFSIMELIVVISYILFIAIYLILSLKVFRSEKFQKNLILNKFLAQEEYFIYNIISIFAATYIFTNQFDLELFASMIVVSNISIILIQLAKLFIKNPEGAFVRAHYNHFRFFLKIDPSVYSMSNILIDLSRISFCVSPLIWYFYYSYMPPEKLYTLILITLIILYLFQGFIEEIATYTPLLSEYLDNEARNLTFISTFGRLATYILYILLIYAGLTQFVLITNMITLYDPIKQMLQSLGLPGSTSWIFVALFIAISSLFPYIYGWYKSKRINIDILFNHYKYIEKLIDIFSFPTTISDGKKLNRLYNEIKKYQKRKKDELTKEQKKIYSVMNPKIKKQLKKSCKKEPELYPRINELNILLEILDDIRIARSDLFKSIFTDNCQVNADEIKDISNTYYETFLDQRDQIKLKIDDEKQRKPLLFIIASFIISPILITILEGIGSSIFPYFVNLWHP